jgi:hypothetical protein
MVYFGYRRFYDWPIDLSYEWPTDRFYEWPMDRFDKAYLMSATATLSNVFVFVNHTDRDLFFSSGLMHSRFSMVVFFLHAMLCLLSPMLMLDHTATANDFGAAFYPDGSALFVRD